MSNPSWQKQLAQVHQRAAKRKEKSGTSSNTLRIAVVGVGSELNGDDAAGIQVARSLDEASGATAAFLALDAGSIPENASRQLRRFGADLVIFVDAADFGKPAGAITWLDPENIDGLGASSHTLPLTVIGGFLQEELDCQVEYLGIQPERLEFGDPLSPAVEQAVAEIVQEMKKEFL